LYIMPGWDLNNLFKKVDGVSVYGLLLTTDTKHPLSKVVSERWYELHNLTGPKFLLVAFHPPLEWLETYRDYWKKELGDDFENIWDRWNCSYEPGVAYRYLDFFEPKLKLSEFPCLVLFTSVEDLEKQKVVVRSLPEWDTDSLYQLLIGMTESILECCDKPIDERMECLRSSLTSPTARSLIYYKHFKNISLDYMKKNPAKVIGLTAGFILSLANSSILPIGATAVAILRK